MQSLSQPALYFRLDSALPTCRSWEIDPARTWMITCTDINFGWMLTYNCDSDYAPLVPAGTVLR